MAEHTLEDADVVLWLVESTTLIGTGEHHTVEQLSGARTPMTLVINKIGTVKQQDEILIFTAVYKDVRRFAEIVPLSALRDESTDLLTELIFKYLPYGPQLYDEDTVTDQSICQVTSELIRGKALHLLSDEAPRGTTMAVEGMKECPNGIVGIDTSIVRERDSRKGIIIGEGGSMLKRIGTEVGEDIERMMGT